LFCQKTGLLLSGYQVVFITLGGATFGLQEDRPTFVFAKLLDLGGIFKQLMEPNEAS
jgi:hypothetical protein